MADKQNRENAQQIFRQFAWSLAGTLADKQKPKGRPQARGGGKGR